MDDWGIEMHSVAYRYHVLLQIKDETGGVKWIFTGCEPTELFIFGRTM